MANFLLKDVYEITGIGIVIVGTVQEGIIKPGMNASIDGKTIQIRAIEENHTQLKEAGAGRNIAINILPINNNSGFFKKIFSGYREEYNILSNRKGTRIDFS
jgi:translation elongation factor EF-1alpha